MKGKTIFAIVLLAILSMLVFQAMADSDSVTAQTTGTNYDPTVDNCPLGTTSFSPTENSTTKVTIVFNVTDTNGVSDLNNSLAKVEFDDNVTGFAAKYESASNTSCTSSDVDANTRQYTCGVEMQFWFQHATNYSIRCYAGDKNDSVLASSTNTNAFDYAQLVASGVDGTTVDFGTITSGQFSTTINDTLSPVNITNTGNTVLATVSLTGANLTQTGKSDINISQFSADDIASYNSSLVTALNTSKQQIGGVSIPLEDSTTGGNTDSLFVFFTVPVTLEPGSYSGTWTLFEES